MDGFGSWEEGSKAADFTVSRSLAASTVLNWLAAYKYTPVELLEPSLLNGIQRIHIPYFSFLVEYRADFSASIGYHRWENYIGYETVYENGRSRQVPREKWRLRTDWRPYSNTVSGNFTKALADRMPQGSDFSPFLNETSFKASELVTPSSIAGDNKILPFARTPKESYNEFVDDVTNDRVSSQIEKSLPGDTYKQLRYDYNATYKCWQVYLPFWHFSWEYQDRLHGALVDGRESTRVTGRLPRDLKLRQSANSALKPLWIVLGVALVLCFIIGSIGSFSWVQTTLIAVIGLATSVVGFVTYRRRYLLLTEARTQRKKAVARTLSSLEENHATHEGAQDAQELGGERFS